MDLRDDASLDSPPQGVANGRDVPRRADVFAEKCQVIQRYVFPGGMLPSPAVFGRHVRRAGLVVRGDLAFGQDYAETLVRWREGFEAALPEVRALGYDERFVRLWRFYLAYCEAGFRAGTVDVHQFQLGHARSG